MGLPQGMSRGSGLELRAMRSGRSSGRTSFEHARQILLGKAVLWPLPFFLFP